MKYANSRAALRSAGGQFREATGTDVGIDGVCPKCRHLLRRVYVGPAVRPLDPQGWRSRCYTCEPKTATEIAVDEAFAEDARREQPSILRTLKAAQEAS